MRKRLQIHNVGLFGYANEKKSKINLTPNSHFTPSGMKLNVKGKPVSPL